MKRFLCCILCVILIFSLTACKDKNADPVKTDTPVTDDTPKGAEKNNIDEVYGQEDEIFTKEITRENGTVYVKSTLHYNHLGYRITFATDLFDVETGEDYEKLTVKNTDGYMLMKAEAFGDLNKTLEDVKSKNKIETEASANIGETEWSVFLAGDTKQATEIFVTEKNRIVYTLTVVQPSEDTDGIFAQAIDDAIFSIEFK